MKPSSQTTAPTNVKLHPSTLLLFLSLCLPTFCLGNIFAQTISPSQDSTIVIDTIYDATGNFSIFTFHKNGNLLSVVDKNKQKTSYSYDIQNRLTKEKFPNGTQKRYEYGANDRLSISVDVYGDSTIYSYNEQNLLAKKDLPGKGFVSYTYTSRGQLASATTEEGYLSMSYDWQGRLSNVDQNGQLVNYQYDEENGRRLITYPSGREVEETVDSLGRPLALREGESFEILADVTDSLFVDSLQKANLIASFSYDKMHRKTGRVLANGTSMELAFDEENRIKSMIHQPGGFAAYSSVYDGRGNKILEENISMPQLSKAFSYDTLNRLMEYRQGDPRLKQAQTNISFEYDAEGNRTKMQRGNTKTLYKVNDGNGYTLIKTTDTVLDLEYDKQQNLLFDGNFYYLFDVERRLKMVFGNTAFPYADLRITYAYDALGRITEVNRGKETRRYFYDENRLIEEHDGGGMVLATFVYEPDSERLVSMRRDGKDYYYHYDIEGSVIALTDKDGEIVERYTYDINGVLSVKTKYAELLNSGVGNPFTFGGMWQDAGTGLYQHQSNFFSSQIGRRMTKDAAAYYTQEGLQPYPTPSTLAYTDTRAMATSRRRLGLGSTEEKVLVIWASLAARGNAFSFNAGNELMERLEMESTKCDCLEETVVVSHGWGWPITKGQLVNGGVYGTVWINGFLGDIPSGRKGEGFKITKRARELKDLEIAIRQKRINFCSTCSIILTGCRVASTGNFVYRLAKMTGCTVLSSHGGCSGYTAPYFTSGPKTTKERNAGEFKGFSVTYPDGRRDLLQSLLRLW